jgi:hypothetical protein
VKGIRGRGNTPQESGGETWKVHANGRGWSRGKKAWVRFGRLA